MKTPPESLKTFCNRIAAAAVAPGGARLARRLRLAGLLGEPFLPAGDPAEAGAPASREAAPAGSGRVGIWERENGDGEAAFVRSLDRTKEWHLWANLGRIEPKGARSRVVLIGESVARGYLYDPELTPAMMLQSILEKRMGGSVEVIDLARTDLGTEVGELARSVLLLSPDAVVVFSGNNWNLSAPPVSGRALIDSVLREEGVPGLKRLVEDQLAAKVRGLVQEVSSLYRTRGIPLVWIVPEFNLGDWRDPVTNAPHLPGTANCDWLACWEAAQQAWEAGNLRQAAERAQRMVEIDQGTCVTGLYLLAECSRRSSNLEAARRWLEQARDAVIWDSSRHISPRVYGVAQEALREEASRHGSVVVDLPRIFREHTGEAIPNRRMFLDYCHLTSEGIRVAMAAAASPVLETLAGVKIPWRDLAGQGLRLDREVEAGAAFLAAVHNAHWWQSRDVIRHCCSIAARTSRAMTEAMTRFIEIQTRRAPMLMCRAAEEIAGLGSRQLQHYLLRYNRQQLDPLLLGAIQGALRETGADLRERLGQLRREEHSLAHGAANLLDFYYCSAGLQPQETVWVMPLAEVRSRKESDFYKAYWIDSRFVFVGETGGPVRLRLTCRLPDAAPERGSLTLSLNGRALARIEAGGNWETWDVSVPGELVREGVNEVSIRWPLPEFPGQQALDSVCDEPVDTTFPELFPCFGEIHSFTASEDFSR